MADLEPGTIPSTAIVGGVRLASGVPLELSPDTIVSEAFVTGPLAPPNPELALAIYPMSITSTSRVPGPWMPADHTGEEPVIEVPDTDEVYVAAGMAVVGWDEATQVTCQPRLNDPGTGSFTVLRPGPDIDDVVGFQASGQRVFTGIVSKTEDKEVAPGEESDQTVTVTAPGLLSEWDQVIVFPDYGSRVPAYLGQPLQDDRTMDWNMDQIGRPGNTILPPFETLRSLELNMIDSALDGLFPLPDVWPDPGARWMWPSNPANPAPRGWCYFRANTLGHAPTGRYQIWAAAHDYAEVWVDGTQVLTCDTPGVSQHVELEFGKRPHLTTIRAYNEAGRAGVAYSMIRVNAQGAYDGAVLRSEENWRCLAYPSRTLRLTPGAVLRQLRYEARSRRSVGDWEFTFDNVHDSAGRPWPDGDVIALRVGDTYLDVLNQLAEDRVDYRPSPSRRRLDMFVKDRGSGSTLAIPWTHTVDLASRGVERASR